MLIIVLSSFKLVFDTYTDKLSENDPLVRNELFNQFRS
jgi:hypothetical protein